VQPASSSRPTAAASPAARRRSPPICHLPLSRREDDETVAAGCGLVQVGSRQEE